MANTAKSIEDELNPEEYAIFVLSKALFEERNTEAVPFLHLLLAKPDPHKIRTQTYCRFFLGTILLNTGQIMEGLNFLQQALPSAEKLGDNELLFDTHFYLSFAYGNLNHMKEEEEEAKHCLMYQQYVDHVKQAKVHLNLHILYRTIGDKISSIKHATQAIELFQKADNYNDFDGLILLLKSRIYEAEGNSAEQKICLEQIDNLIPNPQTPEEHYVVAFAMTRLAIMNMTEGKFEDALQMQMKALQSVHILPIGNRIYLGLDTLSVLAGLGLYDKAFEISETLVITARDLAALELLTKLRCVRGTILRAKYLSTATQNENNKPTHVPRSGISEHIISHIENLLCKQLHVAKETVSMPPVLSGQQLLEQCAKEFQTACDLLTEMQQNLEWNAWKLNFTSRSELWETCHTMLCSVLLDLGQIEKALLSYDSGRSRALQDRLTQKLNSDAVQLTTKKLFSLSANCEAAIVVYGFVPKAPALCQTWGFTQECREQLVIWVINKEQFFWKCIPLQDDLAKITQQLEINMNLAIHSVHESAGILEKARIMTRSEFHAPQVEQDILRELHLLSRYLVHPILNTILDTSKLIIIPDQDLFYVPYSALMVSDFDENSSERFLIEKYSIGLSVSLHILSLLFENGNRTVISRNALVVGNPVPMPDNQQPLEGAENEASIVGKLFIDVKISVKTLLGPQASKEAVCEAMKSAHFIHLATHGYIDASISQDSHLPALHGAVALGGSKLSATEIQDMELNQPELVTLSACSTATGPVTADGNAGLVRAFFANGAQSVLATLWPIKDRASAIMILEFYNNLLQNWENEKKLGGKVDCLAKAMRFMLSKKYGPHIWSGFVLFAAN